MNERETKRKMMQEALDAQKTQLDRNKMGQFSTPYPLALDIMKYMKTIIDKEEVSFIEPSIGTGVFYSAYKDIFDREHEHVLGFEIDPHYYNPSKVLWENTKLEIRLADFLCQQPDFHFDMLVTNPPYVRHHHIDNDSKIRLKQEIKEKTGITISGLAGLYCYFMLLSSAWLKEGGLSCWLVPSEFMDVNYGKAVKEYLLNNVELIRIHRFLADDLQFTDALVSSSIVVFRNKKPTITNEVEFSIGGSINNPESIKHFCNSKLKADEKWTYLFTSDNEIEKPIATIGDYFIVKRGIATGDNSFFIIDQKIIKQFEIPSIFLHPILPGPRYIKSDIIKSKNGIPLVEQQLFLFSCTLPETTIKEKYPKVWEYIELGLEREVNKRYICSRRTPWYSCEERDPAPIIVPYMGRSETNNRMFRFILNKSKAITTNVYLLLFPRPQYAYLMKNEAILLKIWKELNTIPTETLSRNGRFYGGGLRKIEPKELMNTPANNLSYI